MHGQPAPVVQTLSFGRGSSQATCNVNPALHRPSNYGLRLCCASQKLSKSSRPLSPSTPALFSSKIARGTSLSSSYTGLGGHSTSVREAVCSVETSEEPSQMAPKREMQGKLFKYGEKSTQTAFRSGTHPRQAIMIGGLTDGLMATRYVEPLANALGAIGWSLVQPLLSSSYSGYGTASLDQDAAEIEMLIKFLINEEGSEGVVLIGHSTGCQDIVHYIRVGGVCTRAVRAVILQAPVSDREYMASLPDTAKYVELAEKMIKEGRRNELMPREASPEVPITAYRFHSLASFGGDDDMFSASLPPQTLEWKLGHMARVPTQIIFSMADEYVPAHVDKAALLKRLAKAMGGAEEVIVHGGDHGLSNRTMDAVHSMVEFIKRGGPSGWDDPWS